MQGCCSTYLLVSWPFYDRFLGGFMCLVSAAGPEPHGATKGHMCRFRGRSRWSEEQEDYQDSVDRVADSMSIVFLMNPCWSATFQHIYLFYFTNYSPPSPWKYSPQLNWYCIFFVQPTSNSPSFLLCCGSLTVKLNSRFEACVSIEFEVIRWLRSSGIINIQHKFPGE